MCDYCITICLFLTCLYGFILFSWWWYKLRKASTVFICVTFMFLSLLVDSGYSILAYQYLFLHNIEFLDDPMFSTILWKVRSTPLFLTVFVIVVLMTIRVIKNRDLIKNAYRRRITD